VLAGGAEAGALVRARACGYRDGWLEGKVAA